MNNRQIVLKNVCVNNLKNVDLILNQNQLIVFTGVSGSGKSSLAFDTIHIEGQRRYLDSLAYNKYFFQELKKPDFQEIKGLSPTIAIEQKTINKNPRSTVAIASGVYDYLRVLFAKAGTLHCPISNEVVTPQSADEIIEFIKKLKGSKIIILAPYVKNKKGFLLKELQDLLKKGFVRIRLNKEIIDISQIEKLNPSISHNINIVIDRIEVKEKNFSRLQEAIYQALDIGKGFFSILKDKEEIFFSKYAYSSKSKKSYPKLEPQDFSFNHPLGMCEKCSGLGEIFEFEIDKIINQDLSIKDDCSSIATSYQTIRYKNIYDNLARIYKFKIDTPFKNLKKEAKEVFLYGTTNGTTSGTTNKWTKMVFYHPYKKIKWIEYVKWEGILAEAHKRLLKAKSELYRKKMHSLMIKTVCPSCKGNRLKPYPAASTFFGKKIFEITDMSIEKALLFFKNIKIDSSHFSYDIISEIIKRLTFLKNIGLSYLELKRTSPSLSGGEAQRVKIASLLGSGLTGSTYILDEPSIGLHPYDHKKLIDTLDLLKNKGNTVIVVEHDRDTILSADTVVDIGPKAGKYGGKIIAKGTPYEISKNKDSITGKFLKKEFQIKIPKKRRISKNFISLSKVSHNNLKNVDISIPLNSFICVTGVSGSGKSSLISQTLYPAIFNNLHKTKKRCGKYKNIKGLENIAKIIFVDQSPIGRTPRSNPATYISLLDDIRNLFANLPESKVFGLSPGHFSFNVKEGSCPYCKGLGVVKVDMDFMENVTSSCIQCKGMRFSKEILQIKYKEKNIYDVLNLTALEALELFKNIPNIFHKLKLLQDVGMDYIKLGQPSTTISGGEAQRIKLSKELSKKNLSKKTRKNTLYILDEPSRGLHFYDLKKLINVLNDLVDMGNTVCIIEHNKDIIKNADYIIDLGPSGGVDGGKIVAKGSYEEILKAKTKTAIFLKKEKKLTKTKKKQIFLKKPFLEIKKAHQHNLKNISCNIPLNKITVFTGPSGSGKTSLAFDTIYQEAKRRYIESLPSYKKQFFDQPIKPRVKNIENLPPSISIEQKNKRANPRSSVGTITEIYDHLRILYTHLGIAHCPETKEVIKTIDKEYVQKKALEILKKENFTILSFVNLNKIDFETFKNDLIKKGFLRIRLNKKYYELDQKIPYNKNLKQDIFIVVDRLKYYKNIEKRLLESINTAIKLSEGKIILATEKKDIFFNLSFASEKSKKSYPPITSKTFSFNSEYGMCLTCKGLGFIYGINLEDDDEFLSHTIFEILSFIFQGVFNKESTSLIKEYFSYFNIDIFKPMNELKKEKIDIFLKGSFIKGSFIKDAEKVFKKKNASFKWIGLNNIFAHLAKHAKTHIRKPLIDMMYEKTCPSCNGNRLNPLASNVEIKNVSLPSFCNMSIDKSYNFIKTLSSDKKFLKDLIENIKNNLKFLLDIGLGYLSLSRSAPSLSSGELQRIFLAKHLGSKLSNCLYLLDEPTIGLHPYNIELLIKALKNLHNLNNTLIIVEHDPMIIEISDNIIDFGPKAGIYGGDIISYGSLEKIKKDKNSITGNYLSKRKKVDIDRKKRISKDFIKIENAKLHNLKNIDLEIPKNIIVTITGVSGAGKSTIINHILKKAVLESIKKNKNEIEYPFAKISNLSFDKLIFIDQKSIQPSIRSDVSTYTEIMPIIRSFFSSLPLSKMKGLKPRHFSYNHPSGMCRNCYGLGYKKIDLQFLPSIKKPCETCFGYKLNKKSLEVTYKNKHVGQILDLSIEEATLFFSSFPKILKKLNTLIDCGLGYLKLKQELSTLSFGECQRILLAKELSKRSTKNSLYIIDEPSIGLHFEDVSKLIKIFHKMADKKQSIIIIEHNSNIIKSSDYIIDIGPGSGEKGGEIVYFGIPDNIKENSYTGKYLKKNKI